MVIAINTRKTKWNGTQILEVKLIVPRKEVDEENTGSHPMLDCVAETGKAARGPDVSRGHRAASWMVMPGTPVG